MEKNIKTLCGVEDEKSSLRVPKSETAAWTPGSSQSSSLEGQEEEKAESGRKLFVFFPPQSLCFSFFIFERRSLFLFSS